MYHWETDTQECDILVVSGGVGPLTHSGSRLRWSSFSPKITTFGSYGDYSSDQLHQEKGMVPQSELSKFIFSGPGVGAWSSCVVSFDQDDEQEIQVYTAIPPNGTTVTLGSNIQMTTYPRIKAISGLTA